MIPLSPMIIISVHPSNSPMFHPILFESDGDNLNTRVWRSRSHRWSRRTLETRMQWATNPSLSSDRWKYWKSNFPSNFPRWWHWWPTLLSWKPRGSFLRMQRWPDWPDLQTKYQMIIEKFLGVPLLWKGNHNANNFDSKADINVSLRREHEPSWLDAAGAASALTPTAQVRNISKPGKVSTWFPRYGDYPETCGGVHLREGRQPGWLAQHHALCRFFSYLASEKYRLPRITWSSLR